MLQFSSFRIWWLIEYSYFDSFWTNHHNCFPLLLTWKELVLFCSLLQCDLFVHFLHLITDLTDLHSIQLLMHCACFQLLQEYCGSSTCCSISSKYHVRAWWSTWPQTFQSVLYQTLPLENRIQIRILRACCYHLKIHRCSYKLIHLLCDLDSFLTTLVDIHLLAQTSSSSACISSSA